MGTRGLASRRESFALRACDDDGLRFEQRGTLRAEGANAGAGASGADRGERLAFRLGLIEVGLALVDVADLQGGAGYKLDILRLACCQCPLEAALPDEEHETTASGCIPMTRICSANVPARNPTSCSAYTMPAKKP